MALIKCPECDSEVSDKAEKCPKCAYPLNPAPKNQHPVKQENIVHTKIIEIKGSTSILKLYSDYLEGEFFGIAAMGGSFHYKVHYNEINSVRVEKVGETNYLILDYPNKPMVDKLHKLPSNNNFWPRKNNLINFNKAKDIIEFLRNNQYDEYKIKTILNKEFVISNQENATIGTFNKSLNKGVRNGLIVGVITFFIGFSLLKFCSPGYEGFYGVCGFDVYPIIVNKDGSFTCDHGNINAWSYGKWEKSNGGIMVTGLTGDDSNDNGLWKDGKDDALISPSGLAYCKSAYTP